MEGRSYGKGRARGVLHKHSMRQRCLNGGGGGGGGDCAHVGRTSWPKRATSCSLIRSRPRSVTPSRVVASGSGGVEYSRPMKVLEGGRPSCYIRYGSSRSAWKVDGLAVASCMATGGNSLVGMQAAKRRA